MTCERTIRQVTIFTRNSRVACPFGIAPHPVCGRGTKPRGRLRVGLSPHTRRGATNRKSGYTAGMVVGCRSYGEFQP
jgi:hypothetical protein